MTLIRNIRQLLTLSGSSGPRCGAGMSDLHLVPNAAVLVRNGVIEEAGRARRIENLAAAGQAREIDAAGRIVMPAFADVDMELVVPPPGKSGFAASADLPADGAAIRAVSRKSIALRAAALAAERARYGCLTVGARTSCAADLRNTLKILRVQRALQMKPLRVRSVYSHRPQTSVAELVGRWLPALRRSRLASVIEFDAGTAASESGTEVIREATAVAVAAGFAVRLRSDLPPGPDVLELALSSGAISIVAPVESAPGYQAALASVGCVRVVPASEGFEEHSAASAHIRNAIDSGAAVALASGYRPLHSGSFNMQFLLHLAVERLGMTTEEAIVATTYNAICSLRLSHATGSIEPGKSADLIMMNLSDYRDLARRPGHHDVCTVIRAGQTLFPLT